MMGLRFARFSKTEADLEQSFEEMVC